jgi:hypothetical protein
MSESLLPPSSRPLQRGLFGVTLGALAVLLAAKLLWLATIFWKPGEMTYPAGANTAIARRVQLGGALYADWRKRPHMLSVYGPAFYLPVALIGRILQADPHGLDMIARTISLLTAVGTAVLIGIMVRTDRTGPAGPAILMACVFCVADGVLTGSEMAFRPDSPTCFFTLLGLFLASRRDPLAWQ